MAARLGQVLYWICILATLSLPAHAADIRAYHNCGHGYPNCIVINGEIKEWDWPKFHYISPIFDQYGKHRYVDHGAVYLNSPGGLVKAGNLIAFIIQEEGYVTVVPENATCASICANIWLMGRKRYLAPSGHVGFHSASVNGVRSERGNEFIKDRFYNGLEVWKYISGYKALSKEAQDALLAASPNGMLWLTPQIAKTLGIDYEDWPPRKKPTP